MMLYVYTYFSYVFVTYNFGILTQCHMPRHHVPRSWHTMVILIVVLFMLYANIADSFNYTKHVGSWLSWHKT